MKQEVKALFATPVYFSELERNFSAQELQFITSKKENYILNEGQNKTTKDSYVLENDELKKLKEDLIIRINQYFKIVENSEDKINLYITQSWVNFNEPNTSHHEHLHYNSYLSGVLYINAIENLDFIRFIDSKYPIFQFENKKNYNIFNSGVWDFPVKTKQILLFPSHLRHCVLKNNSDHERISLSFNVFLKGIIGSSFSNTELKIGESNDR
jgi:uncharacterized protein (TIGR02466 family)